MPLRTGDFVRVKIEGKDQDNYVKRYERTTSLCSIGDSFILDVKFDISPIPSPYDDIKIKEYWEGSTKTVLRGYIVSVIRNFDGTITLEGMDKSLLLYDYFIPERVDSNGETVDYWISWIASQVGLPIHFYATSTTIVPEDTPLGLQNASDVIEQLERIGGYYVRYSSTNDRLEVFRLESSEPVITINTLDSNNRINAIDFSYGTDKTRNVVKVYGGYRYNPDTEENEFIYSSANKSINSLLVDKISVIANPSIKTYTHANIIANKILRTVASEDTMMHISLEGLYSDYNAGDYLAVWNADLEYLIEEGEIIYYRDQDKFVNKFTGDRQITTISSRVDESGVYTTFTTDEKCPRISIQLPRPPVYITTSGDGVGVSWDGAENFYADNAGLVSSDELNVKGIAANNYGHQMIYTANGFYVRDSSISPWWRCRQPSDFTVKPDTGLEYNILFEDVDIIGLEAAKNNPYTFFVVGIYKFVPPDGKNYGSIILWTTNLGYTWNYVCPWGSGLNLPNPVEEWETHYWIAETTFINRHCFPYYLTVGPDGKAYVLISGFASLDLGDI